jgi:hypothetical protein
MKERRRHGRALTALALALACLLQWGCDRKDAGPPPPPPPRPHTPPPTQPTQPAPTSRPTTQALLTGPRKPLVLGTLPLTMDVPESWTVDTEPGAAIAWLDGPTPHGHVRIELSSQSTPFNAQSLTLMDQQARKEAATRGADAVQITPLHSIGGTARAREEREVHPGTVLDDDGHPRKTDVMDWTIEVYVGQDTAYTLDLLHFAMLPRDVYQQDKDFIEHIVSTLRYDATRGLLQ